MIKRTKKWAGTIVGFAPRCCFPPDTMLQLRLFCAGDGHKELVRSAVRDVLLRDAIEREWKKMAGRLDGEEAGPPGHTEEDHDDRS